MSHSGVRNRRLVCSAVMESPSELSKMKDEELILRFQVTSRSIVVVGLALTNSGVQAFHVQDNKGKETS